MKSNFLRTGIGHVNCPVCGKFMQRVLTRTTLDGTTETHYVCYRHTKTIKIVWHVYGEEYNVRIIHALLW